MNDGRFETIVDTIGVQSGDTLGSQINISIFLVLIILVVFVMPSIGLGSNNESWYGSMATSILFISGIAIAWDRRRLFIIAALIGGAALIIRWLSLLSPSHSWNLWNEVAALITISAIILILILQIFRRSGPITAVSIQGAIAIYLLLGLSWANAYLIAIQLNPRSFQSTVGLSVTSVSEWFYYSYVTLTTLGYGEITPISRVARALAIGEALTGQLYLAVLIARLIGMEIISSQQKAFQNDSDK